MNRIVLCCGLLALGFAGYSLTDFGRPQPAASQERSSRAALNQWPTSRQNDSTNSIADANRGIYPVRARSGDVQDRWPAQDAVREFQQPSRLPAQQDNRKVAWDQAARDWNDPQSPSPEPARFQSQRSDQRTWQPQVNQAQSGMALPPPFLL